MPTEFTMPKLGLTMEEGTIIEWLVDEGAAVTSGAPALVIETDKTETEVEAAASGRLHRTAAVGDTILCGELIGYVLAEGEDPPSGAAPAAATSSAASAAAGSTAVATPGVSTRILAVQATVTPGGRVISSPNARRIAREQNIDVATVAGTGPAGRITSEDVNDVAAGRSAPLPVAGHDIAPTSPGPATPPTAAGPAVASIAARQLADLLGIDLAAVPVDPVEARVTRDGVAGHVRQRLAAATLPAPTGAPVVPAATSTTAPLLQEPAETIRMSGMRGTIAKRMAASLRDMAQLTLTMDADMAAITADRDARKAAGLAPGYTDYVIAAAARALRLHPRVNAQVTDSGIALLPEIHVGLAVALDEGLVVPVVRNTDRLDLRALRSATTRLADAARSASLDLADVEGGTFSVTALGMYGVDSFTPVINPPNAAILGVGRLRDDLELVNGVVTTTRRLTLSLTWDHRVFDGAPAAAFTKTIVDLLADPALLDDVGGTPG